MSTDLVAHLIKPHTKDLGGFSVRRLLPASKAPMVGPWIFFDHMGPATFEPGDGIDVRPHPHINLATVTYLFEGQIFHRDSLGSAEAINPGDINLMVAGSGIVHSERTAPELRQSGQKVHGLQLWLALPEKDEETDPSFTHYDAAELPMTTVNDVPVRVMMGEAFGLSSPVQTFADTLYLEADLKAGQTLIAPAAEQRAVYVASGSIKIGDQSVEQYHMAVLQAGSEPTLEAEKDSRIALVGGEALGKRYIEWNFVSSRKDRIEQAKQDWKNQTFAKVPGDEEEFIPLP